PILSDALWVKPAFRPANMPATKLATMVKKAAPAANQTASANVNGSMLTPKLNKKMAPKKSRNGTTICSIRLLCSVSDSANPDDMAPMASATWMVSEKPATKNNPAKTTMTKISLDVIRNTRFKTGGPNRPIKRNSTMYPMETAKERAMFPTEVAPDNNNPDMTDKKSAKKMSSNKTIPKINSVSGLPVRFKSTSVFATMAVDETDIMPATINVSYSGKPIKYP